MKGNFQKRLTSAIKENSGFLKDEYDYMPLSKCKNTFIGSLIFEAVAFILFMIFMITQNEMWQMVLFFIGLSICITGLTFVNGAKIKRMLDNGEVMMVEGLVIKTNRITKNITIATPDKINVEMMLESDISVKKNLKYKFYYYENDGEYIVTQVAQLSVKKEKWMLIAEEEGTAHEKLN